MMGGLPPNALVLFVGMTPLFVFFFIALYYYKAIKH